MLVSVNIKVGNKLAWAIGAAMCDGLSFGSDDLFIRIQQSPRTEFDFILYCLSFPERLL